MSAFAHEIGQRILAARTRDGLTARELAKAASVHVNAIQRCETGQAVPRAETMVALAGVLDLDLHWVLTGDSWAPRG